MLDSLLPFLERNNRIMMIIEVEILRSIALQLLDDHDGALLAMERALSLAEPEGYVRLFIQEGETVRLLIEDLRLQIRTRQKHGQDREGQRILDYGELLISAFSKPGLEISAISKINDQPSELIEPLSEREMEVLWYLRSRLTVPEIAQELYIAESTVRSHVKSIYSKLNVHRRMDAVRRGEELGLISGAGR